MLGCGEKRKRCENLDRVWALYTGARELHGRKPTPPEPNGGGPLPPVRSWPIVMAAAPPSFSNCDALLRNQTGTQPSVLCRGATPPAAYILEKKYTGALVFLLVFINNPLSWTLLLLPLLPCTKLDSPHSLAIPFHSQPAFHHPPPNVKMTGKSMRELVYGQAAARTKEGQCDRPASRHMTLAERGRARQNGTQDKTRHKTTWGLSKRFTRRTVCSRWKGLCLDVVMLAAMLAGRRSAPHAQRGPTAAQRPNCSSTCLDKDRSAV